MKANLFFILGSLFLLIVSACQKQEIVPPGPGSTFDTQMEVLFMDESGNNLLHSGNFYHLKLYNIIDGKEQEVRYPHLQLDNPRMMSMISGEYGNHGRQNVLRMPANSTDKSKITTTLLKWSTHTDTVRTALYRAPGAVMIEAVWWNDKLVWNPTIATKQYDDGIRMVHRFFEVIR